MATDNGQPMVTAEVHRLHVRKYQSMGWVVKKGSGPTGQAGGGDMLLMEIPLSRFKKLQEERRKPFDDLYRALRRGEVERPDGGSTKLKGVGKTKLNRPD